MTVSELKDYFSKKDLPETLQLDKGNKIVDVRFFVASHFRVLENNPDSKASKPFYDRLTELKSLLENG